HPFRVERMLLQLLHSGVLAAQKAVIFGSFTGSAPNDYDAGYDLPQVFDYLRQQLPLPLISGLEFGHEQRTVTLPLGARARLVNQATATTLTIGGHPVLTE
ncbi:muramoyltetrapeptide carboxypeptidase, partial [Klebsiella pneumoniae]